LPLLVSSARDVPARQQTLRQTIQWSYALLTEAEQRLFRLLSVFVGGCTWQAVEKVADEQISVLDTMTSLLDKNLLRQTEQEDGEPWFMLLETIREFGLEALAERGELEATLYAHAAYYLQGEIRRGCGGCAGEGTFRCWESGLACGQPRSL
jgi:predicted ATPase